MKNIFVLYIVPGLLFVLIVTFSIFNIKNNDTFFTFNFIQALTACIALLIAYLANQYNTDYRKIKEHIENITMDIRTIVEKESFYIIDNTEYEESYLMMQRKVKNYIDILSKYDKKFNIKKYVEYIKNQFGEYNMLVSEHMKDIDFLSKSKNQLYMYSQKIANKCNELIVSLY